MKRDMISIETQEGIKLKVPAHVVASTFIATALAQIGVPLSQPTPAANETASAIPALGEYWPGQGGVNAGLMRGQDGTPDYYLIVAAGSDAEFQDVKWGPYNHTVNGATSPWDGLANTKAMQNDCEPHPAADRATSYSCDGHSDYYLPARRELQLAEANCPEVFSDGWHWSSTQYSANNAFCMDFDGGGQRSLAKYGELRVRPVRRLFI